MSLDVNISEPDEFNCTELHTCIKDVAEMKGISDFEYHVDYVCGKGEHFIANIFRVLINETGNVDNNISVIVKTLVNTTRQELFHELHKREVAVYKDVVTRFTEILDSLDVDERLVLSKCLYSRIEKLNEVMILEDMELKGFRVDNKLAKYENLDYAQVSSVLSELAKFHALSFICEKQDEEYFSKLKSEFHDILFQNSFLNKSKLRNYFFESYEMSLNVITDLEAKKKLETIKSNILEILRLFSKPTKNNVLCHGDCWINNMLFKYEEKKPTKVCFIDFQAMRYANPVTDIIYFMYLCTDSTFRSEYFERLRNVYYDTLKSFLNLYDIDANIVYPKYEFENDITEFIPFGLLISLIELRIITITPEQEAILKGSNILPALDMNEVPGEIEFFKIRVNEIVMESKENGALDKLVNKVNT